MSILNLLKKKKSAKTKKAGKEEKAEKKEEKKEKEISPKTETKTALSGTGKYSGIILHPHVTEKSSYAAKSRQYIFKICKNANKGLVKKAIEDIYNVTVKNVQIINIPSKIKRLGRTVGKKQGYKKAIVRLKEGESIEIMPT